MVFDFKYLNSDQKIYERELKPFIPKKIIDFQIYICKKNCISKDIGHVKKTDQFISFNSIDQFDFEAFENISKKFFSQNEYQEFLFGALFEEVDIDNNNQMIIGQAVKYKINDF